MKGIFTFLNNQGIMLLEAAGSLIPGVDKALIVYYDTLSKQLVCKVCNNYADQPIIEDFHITDPIQLQKLRTKKFQWQWMSSAQLPFETVVSSVKQLSIFDEDQNIVLCLAFNNSSDNHVDLLFLYLNRNNSSFGISANNTKLTTNEKSIIGSLVYNSLNLVLKQQETDGQVLRAINTKVQNIEMENSELLVKLENVNKNYSQSLIEMCRQHLSRLEAKHKVQFDLDSAAIQKIANFKGNFNDIMKSLEYSAQLSINLNYGKQTPTIVLKSWDLDLEHVKQDTVSFANPIAERFHSTVYLLDKLENAARMVANNRMRLTGENVGNACPTPISAPAITDALKNHQKKVKRLMEDYPEKWNTLRNEFRPVKNILVNKQVG